MFKFFFESFGAESVSPSSFLFSFRAVSIRDSKQSLRFSFEYDIKRLFKILGSRWKPSFVAARHRSSRCSRTGNLLPFSIMPSYECI